MWKQALQRWVINSNRKRARQRARPVSVGEWLEVRRLLTVTISVDALANQHLIDPRIYGVAFADAAELAALNVTFNRYGGNTSSTYNWQQNAHNTAADWYYQSVPDGPHVPGQYIDDFIDSTRQGGAEPSITIPMLDWVAKLGPDNVNGSKLASYSIQKYGQQTGADWQWYPDAGNGISSATGRLITGNDPNDAYVPSYATAGDAPGNPPTGTVYQQQFVQHLLAHAGGAPHYYTLDNEPSIWHATHPDVHPQGASMDEVLAKIEDYASMIKSVDPTAQVLGPEEWGWSGYFYSGKDQQYFAQTGDYSHMPPDKQAHGGMDYLPWLLDQLRQKDQQTGQRLLDAFTVHYYPQSGEFSNDISPAMQQLRNQSTRALWDPTYTDPSWINDEVQLIPRLQGWVDQYYPGTEVGLTEYNWGAEAYMNGATTQADVLGIFGREGLDLANRWATPDPSTPTFKAMQMYTNYDGLGSGFGDTSVAVTVPNPDEVSAFAARRSSDGSLTLMVINKSSTANTFALDLSGFQSSGSSQTWQLSAANPNQANAGSIQHLADTSLSQLASGVTLPQQSITMFVLQAGGSGAGNFGSAVSYIENAAPKIISTTATVTNSGGTSFGTGRLTASLIANAETSDRLGIRNVGTGAGQIGVTGNTITYGGTPIATFSGGTNKVGLTIVFNGSSSAAAAQALLRNLTFSSSSENPSTAARTVRVILTDGNGGASSSVTKTINVSAVNDAPVVAGFGGTTAFTGSGATIIDGDASVDDIDSANFEGGNLTVSLIANAQGSDVLAIRNQGTGSGKIGVSGNSVTYGGVAIGTFSGGTNKVALTITLNLNATLAAAQALLRNITFNNTSATRSTAPRTVRVMLNDGDNGVSTAVAKTITVAAGNSPPVIGGFGGSASYGGGSAILVDDDATVTDDDSSNFQTGKLVITLTQNGQSTDVLGIRNVGVAAGQIGLSGNNVTYGNIVIGVFSGGTNKVGLTITFNANATPQAVQALLRKITFRSTLSNPLALPRTVRAILTDGDGGTSPAVTKTIGVG
ncbi:glycoside hydrolase family 44 protein [Planctomicrobium piriforme]|uniref:Glycoside hydrolase family 44 n=1 Tax=Planctomicrobium piriforme TaxID=1576369 RepID=A0A1I3TNL1_9PLAN|nr:glycoside hydrolase family 44 protein [Planctomicrobium piriforme]SFJ71137.1 Glycoside hydrolase family 44 [Planctomicrobium piriforme]